MAWPYDEETGPYGSVSQVPMDTWFGVDTATGEWQRPGSVPTIGAVTGGELDLGLDLTTPFPGAGQAYGVLAPGTPAIGQVTGMGAPPRATPSALPRPPGREPLSALMTPPQPTVWESIARGVGMATPQGRAILQDFDTRQQQQLQNRLVLRRQELQEAQNERSEIRDDFNSLLKISEIKSKALRKLYTDRYVADMQARGKTLPADFIEAFKAAGSDEAQAMLKFYQPLLQDLGLDPVAFADLVDKGGIKEVGEALTLAQKLKKDRTEQQRLATLDQISRGETLGDVSGVSQPAAAPSPEPAPTTTARPTTPTTSARSTLAAPPADIAEEIQKQERLFNLPPGLLQATLFTESWYNKNAKGSAGEIGLMQLKPGTAKDLGVNPHDWRDNIRGGAKYLAQQLTRYGGNEAKALAAYNQGPGAVPVEGAIPPKGQEYAQIVLGRRQGGAPADTRMQVAGPGAPTPTTPTVSPTDQAALTRLKQAIALKDRQIEAFNRVGGEEANRRADNVAKQRDVLQKEYDRLEDRLTETPRAVEKERQLEQAKYQEKQRQQAQPMLPQDRRKLLTDLRSDIRQEPTFKIYQDVRNGYQNVQIGAGRDSSEGDLALIYGLAKILDPGSVVRESEFATVAAAQGKLQQLLNTPQRFFEGDRLTPANRTKLLSMAHAIASEKLKTAQTELQAVYEPLAKEGNIQFSQLLPLSDLPALTPPASTQPPGTLPPDKEDLLKKHQR